MVDGRGERTRCALVTGGAGFIGSHLVERLLNDGWHVRVLDNFATGRPANLAPFRSRIELFEGDVRDAGLAALAAQGVEVLFHLAALPSVSRSVRDPLACNEINVTGTLQMLVAARDAGVRRFVFASSSSIYGDTPTLPKSESAPPNPQSPYAVSKLTGEHYCQVFHRLFALETVCLRFFNVFGPRQDPDSPYAAVIPLFMQAALTDGCVTVFGDGLQSRDFTYVDNVVEALVLAATQSGAPGRVFNVACGSAYTLRELIALIQEFSGRPLRTRYEKPRPGDIRHSRADISLAREHLGFWPSVNFADGVHRTWEWAASCIHRDGAFTTRIPIPAAE